MLEKRLSRADDHLANWRLQNDEKINMAFYLPLNILDENHFGVEDFHIFLCFLIETHLTANGKNKTTGE
jgi:hypothetical protein